MKWSHDPIYLGPNEHANNNGNPDLAEIQAHIGDIIEIHLGSVADLDFGGAGYPSARALQSMDLEVSSVPLPGAVWLLGGGLAALAGLRRRMKS